MSKLKLEYAYRIMWNMEQVVQDGDEFFSPSRLRWVKSFIGSQYPRNKLGDSFMFYRRKRFCSKLIDTTFFFTNNVIRRWR